MISTLSVSSVSDITSSILISTSFHSFVLVVMLVTEYLSLILPCYLVVFLECLMILKSTLDLILLFSFLLFVNIAFFLWPNPDGECMFLSPCVLCLVTQSCPTLCNPMDCSLSGSSVHGDSPGKNTGVGCHALLQEISPPRDRIQVSHIAGIFFIIWDIREALLSS